MKYLTVLWMALVLQGCADVPRALEETAADVRAIAWTRGIDAPAYRDRHGVCHAFSHDEPGALRTLGSQVRACLDGSLPLVSDEAAAPPSVRVVRQTVPASRIDALFARATDRSVLHAAGRRTAAIYSVHGFYLHRGAVCTIVVADASSESTLGHEFKHCVDGEFHDERGVWRQHRAG